MSVLTIPEPPRRRRARTALGLGLGLGGALAFLAARRASAPWPAVLGARGAVSLLYAALGLDEFTALSQAWSTSSASMVRRSSLASVGSARWRSSSSAFALVAARRRV